ncbi:MAG TPA: A24 family peptidase [bacterium]|jgi:leader peptidase (prepilin peptidase)/N-methyltransferase|nr:A24 family peptidase [bacterium]
MLLKPFVGRIIVFSLLTSMYGLAVNFTGVGHTGTCRPLIMGIIFIAAAMVDMETYILPDAFTIGGAILGLLLPGTDYLQSVIGGIVGAAITASIALLSRGGIGGGDIKLSLAMGIFLGWPLILPALAISFLAGGCLGSILVLMRIRRWADPIPFGPFLVVGTLVAQFWGQNLVQWYLITIWGSVD